MNDSLPNFSLMMEALTELEPEIQAAQTMPVAARPSLAESLSRMGPLPREALFLGLASDGLPVLLNLHNAHPGPLLIAADPGAGKTALLQMIARAGCTHAQTQRCAVRDRDQKPRRVGISGQVGTLCGRPAHISQIRGGLLEFTLRLGAWQQAQKQVHPFAGG